MAMATVRTRRADTGSWGSSGDGTNSTDVSLANSTTITTERVSSDAADTCRCQSNAADNNVPSQRSCYDCLNVALRFRDEVALVIAGRERLRSNITTLDIFYTQPEHLQQDERQQQQSRPRAPPLSLGGWLDDREKLKNTGDSSRFRSGAGSDTVVSPRPTTSANAPTQQPSDGDSAIILSRSEHST